MSGNCEESSFREVNCTADPWYGRNHTDVTESHHLPVPSHAIQDPYASIPSFDRCGTDVTKAYHQTRPNCNSPYAFESYHGSNHGKVNSDITRHLQVNPPISANPPPDYYYGVQGTDVTNFSILPVQIPQAQGPNRTEYMHPLGKPRPFPFSQYFFHDGSRYCRNFCEPKNACAPLCISEGPSTSGGCNPLPRQSPRESPSRRSPRHSPNTSRSDCNYKSSEKQYPCPLANQYNYPSRCPSPSKLHEHIPMAYLNCAKGCQLCPPCPACQELLNTGYGTNLHPQDPRHPQRQRAVHCAGLVEGGGGVGNKSYCQFHGTSPCPAMAGLPCYGMRPWSPPKRPCPN